MKKIFITFAVVAIAVVAVSLISFNSIVKNAIETQGSAALGTKVTLGAAMLSPFSGNITLSNLVIDSPEGYSAEHTAKLGRISVTADISSLFSDTVRIKEISVVEPKITYELSARGANMHTLQRRASQSDTASTDETTENKKVVIDNFFIKDGEVTLATGTAGETSVSLPEIHLTDIGKKSEGATIAEAMQPIMQVLVTQVAALNFKDIQNLQNLATGAGGNMEDFTDDAMKQAEEILNSTAEGVEESNEDAARKLQEFFNQ